MSLVIAVGAAVAQTPYSDRLLAVSDGFSVLRVLAAAGLACGAGMTVSRLLLSGLLVASGLILAAFTLHGAFDPLLRQRATQAASGPALKPWSTSTFDEDGGRIAEAGTSKGAQLVRIGTKSEAPAHLQPANATAQDARLAASQEKKRLAERKRAERKRQAEEAEKAKQSQQAKLDWPWNWFGK